MAMTVTSCTVNLLWQSFSWNTYWSRFFMPVKIPEQRSELPREHVIMKTPAIIFRIFPNYWKLEKHMVKGSRNSGRWGEQNTSRPLIARIPWAPEQLHRKEENNYTNQMSMLTSLSVGLPKVCQSYQKERHWKVRIYTNMLKYGSMSLLLYLVNPRQCFIHPLLVMMAEKWLSPSFIFLRNSL